MYVICLLEDNTPPAYNISYTCILHHIRMVSTPNRTWVEKMKKENIQKKKTGFDLEQQYYM